MDKRLLRTKAPVARSALEHVESPIGKVAYFTGPKGYVAPGAHHGHLTGTRQHFEGSKGEERLVR